MTRLLLLEDDLHRQGAACLQGVACPQGVVSPQTEETRNMARRLELPANWSATYIQLDKTYFRP